MDTHLAQGTLFYSGIYISTILIIVAFLTGRLIYIFFIALTLALMVYMNYLICEDSSHLTNVGEWVEKLIKTYITYK